MSHAPGPEAGHEGGTCGFPVRATLSDGTGVVIRPIGPEDAEREQAFVRGLSARSRYFRFMNTLSELSPHLLERFTHPDPAREIALVALVPATETTPAEQIGVARCIRADDHGSAEFAIVVADRFQGRGLGQLLMQELIGCARSRAWPRIQGLVLWNNHQMLALMHALGFAVTPHAEDGHLRVATLELGGNGLREHHA